LSSEDMTELWTARVKDYQTSGERVAAWCERNQVTSHQLYYWMRKVKDAERQQALPAGGEPKWVALAVQDPTRDEAPPIVVKIGGAAVEVRAGFNATVFAEVARTLKALC